MRCYWLCQALCWWSENILCHQKWGWLYCLTEWLGSTLQMVTTVAIEILMFPNASIFTLAHHTTRVLTISMKYLLLVDIVTSHSDLGILFDDQLKFHDHTTKVTTKANWVLGMIERYFDYLNSTMLTHLFSMLVWPILEYGNTTWGPHYTLDMRKIERWNKELLYLSPAIAW